MRSSIYFFKPLTILIYLLTVGFSLYLSLIFFPLLFFILSLDDSLPGMLFPPVSVVGVHMDVSKMFHMCLVDFHTMNKPKVDTLKKMNMTKVEVILYKY